MDLDIVITGNDTSHPSLPPITSKKICNQKVPTLTQIEILLKSIRQNWKGQKVVFFHSLPLGINYKKLLKKYEVDIQWVTCPDYCRGIAHNRITAYEYVSQSTHSLIIDYDLICLKPPKLDFSKDFQAGYAGNCEKLDFNQIYKITGYTVTQSAKQVHYPFEYYYSTNKTDICPYFNNGVIFIKNEFARYIAPELKRVIAILAKQPKPLCSFDFQIAISVVATNLTNNWSLLPKGCNFLGSCLDVRPWISDLSLYHYLGSKKVKNEEIVSPWLN